MRLPACLSTKAAKPQQKRLGEKMLEPTDWGGGGGVWNSHCIQRVTDKINSLFFFTENKGVTHTRKNTKSTYVRVWVLICKHYIIITIYNYEESYLLKYVPSVNSFKIFIPPTIIVNLKQKKRKKNKTKVKRNQQSSRTITNSSIKSNGSLIFILPRCQKRAAPLWITEEGRDTVINISKPVLKR